jgi:S-adenosyl-L-methionine hydrolase (adenosine-forming)
MPPSPSPISPSPRHRVSSSPVPVITLVTDFGTTDYFVGAMKGVILSNIPNARIIDITHEIPAEDIEAAAFTLLATYSSFPAGTIHVAVVDPGVGSSRRPLLITAGDHFFVGPDNGIFSYVCERESDCRVFEVTNKEYFRHPVSATFHGRDVFAPIAAALATGVKPRELGTEIKKPVRLAPLLPAKPKNGKLKARIIHIDRFGNCITNLTAKHLTAGMIANGAHLVINGTEISSFRNFFSEKNRSGKELFCIWGSAGFLEIAATNKSAARILKAKHGQPVIVRILED